MSDTAAVYTVFDEMCQRGSESPELRVYLDHGGLGPKLWRADYGGYHGWSVTPWGAVEDLGKKLLHWKEPTI